MIDWLTYGLPCSHSEPISDGSILSVTPSGDIEWESGKRLSVRGSHEINIHVKTDRNSYDPNTGLFTQLHVDGNPVKWIQGHNIFGTDDVTGLALETGYRLYNLLGITPTSQDLKRLLSFDFPIHRVDINYSFSLGTQVKVLSLLKSLEGQAHMRHRGKGMFTGKTLYFGKKSRRWSLKMYSKGEEITSKKKGHQLHRDLTMIDSLYSWADQMLRIELTLRSLQLKDTWLATASYWEENTPIEQFKLYVESLEMSSQLDLKTDALSSLPSHLKPVYALWKSGEDLRAFYAKNTFYRHRRALLKLSIDISIIQPSKQDTSNNVIPFAQALDNIQFESIPDWARGTDLYFEPRYFG